MPEIPVVELSLFRSVQEPKWESALGMTTVGTTVFAFLALLILFFWTITSDVFAIDGREDDSSEERAELKLALNLLLLIVSAGALFLPMNAVWSRSRGEYSRYKLGALAGSIFLVGNMLFVSFLYTVHFGGGGNKNRRFLKKSKNKEDDDDGSGGGGNWHIAHSYNYATASEEEIVYHDQNVVSTWSAVLALGFFALAAVVYLEGRRVRETGPSVGATQVTAEKAKTHVEKMSKIWVLVSATTTILLAMTFTMECVNHNREDNAANLIAVLFWTILTTAGVHAWGHKALRNLDDSLALGALAGGTAFHSLLLFAVTVLFAHLTHDDRYAGAGPATITSFVCFGLSSLHLAFLVGMIRYQSSFLMSITEGDAKYDSEEEEDTVVVEDGPGGSPGATGDFVRV